MRVTDFVPEQGAAIPTESVMTNPEPQLFPLERASMRRGISNPGHQSRMRMK